MNKQPRTRWILSGAILTREPFAAAPGGWRWKAERTRGRLVGYTDHPNYYSPFPPYSGGVLWDWPGLFPPAVRARIAAIITREYERATNERGR